ncbi:MAG: histidine kinase [Symbiobacteriia bacterium]
MKNRAGWAMVLAPVVAVLTGLAAIEAVRTSGPLQGVWLALIVLGLTVLAIWPWLAPPRAERAAPAQVQAQVPAAEGRPERAGETAEGSTLEHALQIGHAAMPYLRQGLNESSAQKITEIIHRITDVDAVAITDQNRVLGFSGVGCNRHRPGGPILTGATRRVLNTGKLELVTDPARLTCDEPGCPHPLKSAVIAPLTFRSSVVGTVKLYRTSPTVLPPYVRRVAVGIAQLLSIQMELAEADRQRELATKARLEALQAQIRPHFLFNVLNTIIHFSRTDVEKARELLIQLSSFFRRSLSTRGNFITLQEEMEYLNTYLSLERARYGDKLEVRLRIDPRALGQRIPILTLQPLVENAVVHGVAPMEGHGVVAVSARRRHGLVVVTIVDNGIGMTPEEKHQIFDAGFGKGMGLGLSNVNDRLISLYGLAYRLRVRSAPGKGTAVRLRVPLLTPHAGEEGQESVGEMSKNAPEP